MVDDYNNVFSEPQCCKKRKNDLARIDFISQNAAQLNPYLGR